MFLFVSLMLFASKAQRCHFIDRLIGTNIPKRAVKISGYTRLFANCLQNYEKFWICANNMVKKIKKCYANVCGEGYCTTKIIVYYTKNQNYFTLPKLQFIRENYPKLLERRMERIEN